MVTRWAHSILSRYQSTWPFVNWSTREWTFIEHYHVQIPFPSPTTTNYIIMSAALCVVMTRMQMSIPSWLQQGLLLGTLFLGRKAPELIHPRSLRRSFRHRTWSYPQQQLFRKQNVWRKVRSTPRFEYYNHATTVLWNLGPVSNFTRLFLSSVRRIGNGGV